MQRDLFSLPSDLPAPKDDGACDHLAGLEVPNINLSATTGQICNLKEISNKPTVFFFYPRTGRPEEPAPKDWDLIPGARGCTPQSCGFRDLYSEFQKRGINVFAISSQSTDYQQEFAKRNEIPFAILSDKDFELTNTLKIPTFEYNSMRLIKRMALFVDHARIVKFFYPVFPPDQNASVVLDWIDKSENERKTAALWYIMR